MTARRFSASVFVGLLLPGFAHGQVRDDVLTLQHVTAALEPAAPYLTLHYDPYAAGSPWARRGGTIVVKDRSVLRVVDAASLRVVRTIPFRGFLCGMDFDGPGTLVVLSGCDRAWRTHFLLRRVDLSTGRVLAEVRTRRLAPLVWPYGLALGDGSVFIARGNGVVQVVDGRTGAVTAHRPRRALAKGSGYVEARWLGEHQLALNGTVVDTVTWRARTYLRGRSRIAVGGDYLVAWGAHGASVFSRAGGYRFHVLGREPISDVRIEGSSMYATVGAAVDVVDLTTGDRRALLLQYFSSLLAP